jgi:hypothetical protein
MEYLEKVVPMPPAISNGPRPTRLGLQGGCTEQALLRCNGPTGRRSETPERAVGEEGSAVVPSVGEY